ncbi:hypothetical protein GEMRC1_003228 [Eukaryota sp. GEM-RC1]
MGTPWETKEVFNNNFFDCWKPLIKGLGIKSLKDCDFSLIKQHIDAHREVRKNRTKEEKEEEKKVKEEEKDKYGYAKVDGRIEPIANFRVEPPVLFRGRGAHPKMGVFKARIEPEQVTINLGEDEEVPKPGHPYEGRSYGNVVHVHNKEYLAYWTEPTFGLTKYVRLAATSVWKGQSDLSKFEVARKLAKTVDVFRQKYWSYIQSTVHREQQIGVVLYLIDHFAFRVGHAKGNEEADTVGCCSLRVDHVMMTRRKRWWRERGPGKQKINKKEAYSPLIQSDNEDAMKDPEIVTSMGTLAGVSVPLLPPYGSGVERYEFEEDNDDGEEGGSVGGDALMGYSGYEREVDGDLSDDEGRDGVFPYYVVFDFLGKDSVRFFQRRRVHQIVWHRLLYFQEHSDNGDLFYDINPTFVNNALKEFSKIDNISGKSIRTFNASSTLASLLPHHSITTTGKEREALFVAFFNECNKKVAVLCNHQRAVAKSFDSQVSRIEEKIQKGRVRLQYHKDELRALENEEDPPEMPELIRTKPKVRKPKEKVKEEDSVEEEKPKRTRKSKVEAEDESMEEEKPKRTRKSKVEAEDQSMEEEKPKELENLKLKLKRNLWKKRNQRNPRKRSIELNPQFKNLLPIHRCHLLDLKPN